MQILPPKRLSWKTALQPVNEPATPFQYRHQLRLKITPGCIWAAWLDNGRLKDLLQFKPDAAAHALRQWLEAHAWLHQPRAGVSISLWPDKLLLLRNWTAPENVSMQFIHRQVITQPETLRPDLFPDYRYCLMTRKEGNGLLLGIHPPQTCLDLIQVFPPQWPVILWHGPCSFTTSTPLPPPGTQYLHILLTAQGALYLIHDTYGVKHVFQDRALLPGSECLHDSKKQLENLLRIDSVPTKIFGVSFQDPAWSHAVFSRLFSLPVTRQVYEENPALPVFKAHPDMFPDRFLKEPAHMHYRSLLRYMPLWQWQVQEEFKQENMESLAPQAHQWLAWRNHALKGGIGACSLAFLWVLFETIQLLR